MNASVTPLRISLPTGRTVSGILQQPGHARACFVFAHGAGAGMEHHFMSDLAAALGDNGIATLRYQFPYMEDASKRPDSPPVAHAAVRAAVEAASGSLPGLPLFAGGKSFGGRMTSQAQAVSALANVLGLIFVGFPLHTAGKPSRQRAEHLSHINVPMLFLQGTRDELADLALMQTTALALGKLARLHVVEGADHAFHVLVRSGRTDAQVIDELSTTIANWIESSIPA